MEWGNISRRGSAAMDVGSGCRKQQHLLRPRRLAALCSETPRGGPPRHMIRTASALIQFAGTSLGRVP